MSKIIFDVGANNGHTFFQNAIDGDIVYAFEPTPELINYIKKVISEKNIKNYNLIEAAVSDFEGTSKFNIAGQGDWGCSSLHEFSENLDKTWPGRSDFKVTHVVEVKVIRMDNFIKKNNIESIDYLHIDTQGNDLNVLKSFGNELHRVKEGVMEVPYSVFLYKNIPSKKECIDFLESNGFEITSVENNGGLQEQNVYFKKRN